MICPKCGNPRFEYDQRYQSYVCKSCKYEDRGMLTPAEESRYNEWVKFYNSFMRDFKEEVNDDAEYSKFKFFMNRYMLEEVDSEILDAGSESGSNEDIQDLFPEKKKRGRRKK